MLGPMLASLRVLRVGAMVPSRAASTSAVQPESLGKMAQAAVADAQAIIGALCSAPAGASTEDPVGTLQAVDAISDSLCRAVDWLAVLGSTHPEPNVSATASAVNNQLMTFLYHLNTHEGLYAATKAIVDSEDTMASLTGEQARVATLFTDEFERHGVHLDGASRDTLRSLLAKGFELSSLYESNVKGHATQGSVPDNVEVLESLLRVRHETAVLLGKPSYAAFVGEEKMVSDPKQVIARLEARSARLARAVQPEVQALLQAKLDAEGPSEITDALSSAGPASIPIADRMRYAPVLAASLARDSPLARQPIQPYLSLRSGIEGVALVAKSLFGLKIVPSTPVDGETVAPSVLKYNVLTESGGTVGTVYMDPWPRAGKAGGAVHLNILSGRALAGSQQGRPDAAVSGGQPYLDLSMGTDPSEYQAPSVVLVFNFRGGSSGGGASGGDPGSSLLSTDEFGTLFHEWGHALHSLCARTQFHHVAGTRVPLDFVEFPSSFLEKYAWEWPVVSQVCRHYQTGAPIPRELFDAHAKCASSLCTALNEQSQLNLALMDTKFHLAHAAADAGTPFTDMSSGWTTRLANKIHAEHSAIEHPAGTLKHSHFTHLVNYGSSYYSYSLCRDLADEAWDLLAMDDDPLDRERGLRLANASLLYGNAKAPIDQMRDLGITWL